VALTEWLKIGDAASLQGANLAQHPLVMAALNGLASESAFDEAVDATVELVYSTSSGGQPDPSMLSLVSVIVPSVSSPPSPEYRVILEAQVMLHSKAFFSQRASQNQHAAPGRPHHAVCEHSCACAEQHKNTRDAILTGDEARLRAHDPCTHMLCMMVS